MRKLFSFILIIMFVAAVSLYGGDKVQKADKDIPSSDEFIPVETMPELIKQVAPDYPKSAKKAGIEGYVFIQAFVDKTGVVKKAKVMKSSKEKVGFEEAAVKAAYLCRYKPALQNGKPIGIWISYKVDFTLDCKE